MNGNSGRANPDNNMLRGGYNDRNGRAATDQIDAQSLLDMVNLLLHRLQSNGDGGEYQAFLEGLADLLDAREPVNGDEVPNLQPRGRGPSGGVKPVYSNRGSFPRLEQPDDWRGQNEIPGAPGNRTQQYPASPDRRPAQDHVLGA